ncbi:hypothetical protein Tco_0837064 [Tanacetum coccineum]
MITTSSVNYRFYLVTKMGDGTAFGDVIELTSVPGASVTQGMVSSIPIVGSISPKGFLPPIMLLVVMVVVVMIIGVVVVVAVVGVVIVVVIIGVVVVGGNPPMKAFSSFSVQIVEFIFHLSDFSSGTILVCQKPFQLSPDDLIGLIYSHRLGVCIPPGQSIIRVPLGPLFLLGLLVLAIVAAYASSAVATLSATSFLMAA